MIHFYKPNPKITGSACSFWHSDKDGNFFATLLKQAGWNEKAKTGSFVQNKNDPTKKITVKLNRTEIAAIIDSLQSGREFKSFHSSERQVVRFNFCEYVREGVLVGHSFGANKEAKDDSTQKVSAVIAFTFPEMTLLIEHLKFLLHKDFYLSEQSTRPPDDLDNARAEYVENTPPPEPAPLSPFVMSQLRTNLPKNPLPIENKAPNPSQNDDDIW